MLPVKSGSITPAFTSSSYSIVRPDLDINWAKFPSGGTMARSIKTVFCSFGCIRKSIGVNKSYPTDPGVARCGLTAFSDNFWKYVSSTGCR